MDDTNNAKSIRPVSCEMYEMKTPFGTARFSSPFNPSDPNGTNLNEYDAAAVYSRLAVEAVKAAIDAIQDAANEVRGALGSAFVALAIARGAAATAGVDFPDPYPLIDKADKTINETLFAACRDLFDEGTWRAAFQNLANAEGIQPFAQIVAAMGAPSTLADTSATDVLDAASALLKTPKA